MGDGEPPDPRLVVSRVGGREGVWKRTAQLAAPRGRADRPISSASLPPLASRPPLASSLSAFLLGTWLLARFQLQTGFPLASGGSQPTTAAEFDARLAFVQPETQAPCPFGCCSQPFQPRFFHRRLESIRTPVDLTFHSLQVLPAMSLLTATLVVLLTSPAPFQSTRPRHNTGKQCQPHVGLAGFSTI